MRDALVLGAAGCMGKPLTAVLAHRGWRVTAVDLIDCRFTNDPSSVSRECLDLTDEDAVENFVRQLIKKNRVPDAVVFLAAIHAEDNEPHLNFSLFSSVIRTNMMSVFQLLAALLPIAKKPVTFIFCSSGVVIFPNPAHMGYYLSKLAVTRAFEQFESRYRPKGLRFKTVILGPIDSPMLRASMPPGPIAGFLRRLTTGDPVVAAVRIADFIENSRSRLYYRRASAVVLWAARFVQALLPMTMKFYRERPCDARPRSSGARRP